MATPYITPNMLTTAPTGISWSIIPMPKATTAAQAAEQYNICWRATAIVDGYVNQVFRSTIDTEEQQGPNYYITVDNNTGQVRWILSRGPVTEILAAQTSANILPPSWNQVTNGQWRIERPVIGMYGSYLPGGSGGSGGQTIYLGAGWGGWNLGRNGWLFSCTYTNGWPHAGLTTSAIAGATTLTVDDVTGFAGASAFIYDGTDSESIQVTSVTAVSNMTLPNGGGTAPAGPGTLTLASPLAFAHTGAVPAEVVVSAIPSDVLWATVQAGMIQALDSGITSVSIQNVPGGSTTGGHGIAELESSYELLLEPYKRVI